jgi:hypothetical protein
MEEDDSMTTIGKGKFFAAFNEHHIIKATREELLDKY